MKTVCIDDWRGRRAAAASGLKITGTLGLLGRAKAAGLIEQVRPWVGRCIAVGSYLHRELVKRFLAAMNE